MKATSTIWPVVALIGGALVIRHKNKGTSGVGRCGAFSEYKKAVKRGEKAYNALSEFREHMNTVYPNSGGEWESVMTIDEARRYIALLNELYNAREAASREYI